MVEAVDWLRKGEVLVERMELRNGVAPGLKDLRVSFSLFKVLR